MKITINDKDYELKYTFRSLMIYENITGQSFQPKSLTDVLVFFYSTVLAADKTTTISFNDFMDWLDANPMIVSEFSQWLTDTFTANGIINPNEEKNVDEQPKNE